MLRALHGAWNIANRLKAAWEWYAMLVALGLFPTLTVMFGVFEGQPWSVVFLYATAFVAFFIVIVAEGKVIAEGRTQKQRRLQEAQQVIHDGVMWKLKASAADGPYCPTNTGTALVFQTHRGRRAPCDSDAAGGAFDEQLYCETCTARFDLGSTAGALRTVGQSRKEALAKMLEARNVVIGSPFGERNNRGEKQRR